MNNWKHLNEESKNRWETIADYWDETMGMESNSFHRDIIRPSTLELLQFEKGQEVLDVSCGNGNFSRYLAELGTKVLAFDYSTKLIEHAKRRSESYADRIDYRVVDATDYDRLLQLGTHRFDAAVANMAVMDISDISILARALPHVLKPKGKFVFSLSHPCFQTPGNRLTYEEYETAEGIQSESSVKVTHYLHSESHEGIALRNQAVAHFYFHRSLSTLLNTFFKEGWAMTGIEEPTFKKDPTKRGFQWTEIPPAMVVRLELHSI